MRSVFYLLLTLSLAAQDVTVPCEPSTRTLKLLEAIPPVRDESIPYEQRVGALYALAQQNPKDFFIQRAYQDSFRHSYFLGDEFDRALALYHQRSTDRLSSYYRARLLMYAQPEDSRMVFEQLLKQFPQFVWPHIDFVEWTTLPGRRRTEDAAPHLKAFQTSCPDALVVGGRGMDQPAAVMRRGLERRNTWLDFDAWVRLWSAEEHAGIGTDVVRDHVRDDLKRIEGWPFRADPKLIFVYREASRILHEPELLARLQTRVKQLAPQTQLACSLTRVNEKPENSEAGSVANNDAGQSSRERQAKDLATARERLRSCPADWSSLVRVWHFIQTRAHMGEAGGGSVEDLAIIDQLVNLRQTSPDAGIEFPPLQTAIARVYVAGKVRLSEVPKLLDAGLQAIERQEKYRPSMALFPEEMRNRAADWRTMTVRQSEEIRLDYFLATNRPADARVVGDEVLVALKAARPSSDQESRRLQYESNDWLRRLGNVDAQEGKIEDALRHYQLSLSGLSKEVLARAVSNQPQLIAVKEYYLSHGGTDENWPDWATQKNNTVKASGKRPAPAFVKVLPEFSATDITGKIWRLENLSGAATFVNLWATWCGPCRGEHPDLQKLYEATKDRKDVQVLTISVDDSPEAVKAYMKEKGYTFPVIHAPELADRLFPYVGLPTNFLVNARGVRTSLYGFMAGETGRHLILNDLDHAAQQAK